MDIGISVKLVARWVQLVWTHCGEVRGQSEDNDLVVAVEVTKRKIEESLCYNPLEAIKNDTIGGSKEQNSVKGTHTVRASVKLQNTTGYVNSEL